MQFPTGGIAREPNGMIRLESGADSQSLDGRNWMEETGRFFIGLCFMKVML